MTRANTRPLDKLAPEVTPDILRMTEFPGSHDWARRRLLTAFACLPTLFGLLSVTGCAHRRPNVVPLVSIEDRLPRPATGRTLVVFLPGISSPPREFRDHHYFDEVRRLGWPIDMIAVDAHRGYYDDRSVVDRLREDIVRPARARGYARIWLVGISLGGLGSMLYASQMPARNALDAADRVDGIVPIAPFVGSREVIAEVRDAGGLARWNPPLHLADGDWERHLLVWLKSQTADEAVPASERVPMIFAWGDSDRFAPSIDLVSAALPADRRITLPGGHDWDAWTPLWRAVLDRLGPDF
jgi:pimeloyl-ACP methyl ester carboxylesterase